MSSAAEPSPFSAQYAYIWMRIMEINNLFCWTGEQFSDHTRRAGYQFHTISELVQTDDMPSTLFHSFERTWPLRADVICTEDLTPPNTHASHYSKCRELLYFKASHHNKSWLTQSSVWVTGGSQELSQTPSIVHFHELTLLHRKGHLTATCNCTQTVPEYFIFNNDFPWEFIFENTVSGWRVKSSSTEEKVKAFWKYFKRGYDNTFSLTTYKCIKPTIPTCPLKTTVHSLKATLWIWWMLVAFFIVQQYISKLKHLNLLYLSTLTVLKNRISN